MRIRLVVTGDLEKLALAPSIQRIFWQVGAKVEVDSFKVSKGAMTFDFSPR